MLIKLLFISHYFSRFAVNIFNDIKSPKKNCSPWGFENSRNDFVGNTLTIVSFYLDNQIDIGKYFLCMQQSQSVGERS